MANRAAHLFAAAGRHPDKVAIVWDGARLTFADLARQVREAAGGLSALGVGPGVHVGIMVPSSPAFVVVQQALFMLGAIVSPLNTFYRAGEVAHAVRSCDLAYLVMSVEFIERVPPAEAATSFRLAIVIDGVAAGAASLAEAVATTAPCTMLAPVAGDKVVMLLLTSATTGKAKGVMLTAANLAANYDATPGWLGLDGDDVILCALPLYNTFGLNQCINAMLSTGATMVLLPRFDAAECIDAIARHGCTFFPAVPTMLQKVLSHDGLCPGALASLARVMTGGAPVPASLLRRILAAAPNAEVLTGYGLTEATALVTLTPVRLGRDGEIEHGRTIGKVLDGMELRIVDDDGASLASDAIGEIAVRGPNLMRGYYNAPVDTAIALQDGWLRTGDLGTVDADGYAFVVDRKKDIIIRGGQNIYPADIEEVIYQLPGVAEVAVVGVPDDVLGEIVVAYVACRSPAISETMLIEHCAAELARYKVPAAVHFLAELPKGPTGKILRRELRPVPAAV